jgi:hypothetical protein
MSHQVKGELICLTCAGLNGEEDGPEDVCVVVAPLVLYHGDQALQAHPAVNMLAEQNFFLTILCLEITIKMLFIISVEQFKSPISNSIFESEPKYNITCNS